MIRGMVDLYFMVFVHIGSRQIGISPCTILQHDQDAKYVQAFDGVIIGEGRTIKKMPSPLLGAARCCVVFKPRSSLPPAHCKHKTTHAITGSTLNQSPSPRISSENNRQSRGQGFVPRDDSKSARN